MKSIVFVLIAIAVVALVQGQGPPTRNCPQGEHSVLYCPPKAEPSCDKPYFHDPSVPQPCDIPECFCNTGTIRNTHTGKCVKPSDC